jgi:hypothetical protein
LPFSYASEQINSFAVNPLPIVIQFVECFLALSFRAGFIGEESASVSRTADFSRDTAALRNDNPEQTIHSAHNYDKRNCSNPQSL